MKIAAVCCTYLRPETLGRMVRCFELQDYPAELRQLVILDDAGQYDDRCGDRWRLVSTDRRYNTLGEKRNAAAELVDDDVEALAVWDDDDLYLPWALRASAATLEIAPWSRPSVVLHPGRNGSLSQHATGGLFHGGWAYTRAAFRQIGGYPAVNNGEDQAFAARLKEAGVPEADPIELEFQPFYIYPWSTGQWHLSAMGQRGYQRLGVMRSKRTALPVTDPPNIDLRHPQILPGVRPRMF